MLIVKVLFFTRLREITGKKEEIIELTSVNVATIETILEVLNNRFGTFFLEYLYDPKTKDVRGFLQFLINSPFQYPPLKKNQGQLKHGNILDKKRRLHFHPSERANSSGHHQKT